MDQQGFAPYFFHKDGILSYADLAAEDYQLPATGLVQPTRWRRGKARVWIEPYFDEGGGRGTDDHLCRAGISHRTKTDQRFLYAVVTADVALAELHGYLQRLHLGVSEGFGTLLSRNGIVLSSRNPDNIMRHYSEVHSRRPGCGHTWREMFSLRRWQARR